MEKSLLVEHFIPGNGRTSQQTVYRRALPIDTIAFASPEGRALFAEALATQGMSGYFPLAEQFHTQADPSYCGLGSLVMTLNALGIDPERSWKGPWRWFTEDLLDCCVPLSEIRKYGLSMDQVACLARCNGAVAEMTRANDTNLAAWRAALEGAANGNVIVVASYDRSAMGQAGSGHFSPIGGYHESRDLTLILDVARFKYPPHWVSVEQLWRAMHPVDPTTGEARGWITLRRSAQKGSRKFNANCGGLDTRRNGLATGIR